MALLGDDAEPIDRLGREHREIDRLGVRLAGGDIEAGQPQQVVEECAHPPAFAVDPPEGVAVPLAAAFLCQCETRMGLDHRQRRPQLVRRVGGELHLALARLLDRGRDTASDGDGAEEDDEQQNRSDQDLGEDDRRLRLGYGLHRLADDDVVAVGHVGAHGSWRSCR